MPAFEFQALSSDGSKRRGVMDADSERQVRARLREDGLSPVEVTALAASRAAKSTDQTTKPARSPRIPTTELALMLRQLATLTRAGLPLDEVLLATSEQLEHDGLKRITKALQSRVKEGHALATAMAEFPKVFDGLIVSSVRAGEESGQLDDVLERLADYVENRVRLGRDVYLAIAYPALLAIVSVAVIIGLLTYVVPQVVDVFTGFDRALPILTKVLLAISGGIRVALPWLLLGGAAAVVAILALARDEQRLENWHRLGLRLPLLGRLWRDLDTARYAHTMAILLGGGVAAVKSQQLAAETINNRALRADAQAAAVALREGMSLARAMRQGQHWPPLLTRLIDAGERSGQLAAMLAHAASATDEWVTTRIKTVVGVLEPLLILVVGAVVLFIVLAILMPIFDLNTMLSL